MKTPKKHPENAKETPKEHDDTGLTLRSWQKHGELKKDAPAVG